MWGSVPTPLLLFLARSGLGAQGARRLRRSSLMRRSLETVAVGVQPPFKPLPCPLGSANGRGLVFICFAAVFGLCPRSPSPFGRGLLGQSGGLAPPPARVPARAKGACGVPRPHFSAPIPSLCSGERCSLRSRFLCCCCGGLGSPVAATVVFLSRARRPRVVHGNGNPPLRAPRQQRCRRVCRCFLCPPPSSRAGTVRAPLLPSLFARGFGGVSRTSGVRSSWSGRVPRLILGFPFRRLPPPVVALRAPKKILSCFSFLRGFPPLKHPDLLSMF